MSWTRALAASLTLIAAVPASAGVVSTPKEFLVFRAGPGEANRIRVAPSFTADGAEAGVKLSDRGTDPDATRNASCASDSYELDCAARFVILHCGDRDDLVIDPYDRVLLGDDCERVRFSTTNDDTVARYSMTFAAHPVALSHLSATFVLHCPVQPRRKVSCRGAMTLRARGRRLGRERYSHSGRDAFKVQVVFNALGRRMVSRDRGVIATASVPVPFYAETAASSWQLRLDPR
ncbi:MAG: hypothetical protein ACJ762_02365 [Solirubrobacteraceae bacterium]